MWAWVLSQVHHLHSHLWRFQWPRVAGAPKPYLLSGLKSLAVASLFSLSFSQRKIDSVEGPCYEGLEYVTCKFVHDLTGNRKYVLICLLLK